MDETDEGWLLQFYCHNTLPEPALKLIIHLFKESTSLQMAKKAIKTFVKYLPI